MKIRKAIFPVAGLGTRFLPVTKAIPKEMLPVLNKPLIQYAVEEARAAGIEEMLFINGRGKSAIEDYFDHAVEVENVLAQRGRGALVQEITHFLSTPGRMASVRQMHPRGLGHAVLCARAWVGTEPFAVILPDDLMVADEPCLRQMVHRYQPSHGNVAAIVQVPLAHVERYGILDPSRIEANIVLAQGVVEKPKPETAPSQWAIMGRYILCADVFIFLEKQESGAGGEVQLTDTLAAMIPTHGLTGYQVEATRFDCGSLEGMVAAQVACGLRDPAVSETLFKSLQDILDKVKSKR